MAEEANKEELAAIRKLFKASDTNGNGVLDKTEMLHILKEVLVDFADEDLEDLFDAADTNQNGSLNYDEFLTWIFAEMEGEGGDLLDETLDQIETGEGKIIELAKKTKKTTQSKQTQTKRIEIKSTKKVSKKASSQAASKVHMLIAALNYEGYETDMDPLTCIPDAQRLIALAKKCGVTDITYLVDKPDVEGSHGWPSKANIISQWHEVASRCQSGETFIFFYSGHGDTSKNKAGAEEEADGVNEEICIVDEDGTYNPLLDNDIAQLLQGLQDGIRVLVITDCCCSGTMCDLDSADMGTKAVVHFAAVKDSQGAVDLGDGGALTSALCEVIAGKVEEKAEAPSAADVFNWCWDEFGQTLQDEDQTLTVSRSKKCKPGAFPWPLWPGKGSDYDVETSIWELLDEEDEEDEGEDADEEDYDWEYDEEDA